MLGEPDFGSSPGRAFPVPRCHQITCFLRSSNVECGNSITDFS
jgi:hypothetical protein